MASEPKISSQFLADIAGAPDTLPHDLALLVEDERAEVWRAALKNPNLPKEALESAMRSTYGSKRELVAIHPKATPEILVRLLSDEDPDTRWNAISNPNMPLEEVEKASWSESDDDRVCVALNTAAPLAIWRRLANERNRAIDEALAMNDAVPDDLVGEISQRYPDGEEVEIESSCYNRIVKRFGLDSENEDAVRYLWQFEWWTLDENSPEMFVTKSMHQDKEV